MVCKDGSNFKLASVANGSHTGTRSDDYLLAALPGKRGRIVAFEARGHPWCNEIIPCFPWRRWRWRGWA